MALLVALEIVGAGVPVNVPVMWLAVQFSLVSGVLDAFARVFDLDLEIIAAKPVF